MWKFEWKLCSNFSVILFQINPDINTGTTKNDLIGIGNYVCNINFFQVLDLIFHHRKPVMLNNIGITLNFVRHFFILAWWNQRAISMALNSTKFSTEMFADKLQMDTLIRFQINVYSSVFSVQDLLYTWFICFIYRHPKKLRRMMRCILLLEQCQCLWH